MLRRAFASIAAIVLAGCAPATPCPDAPPRATAERPAASSTTPPREARPATRSNHLLCGSAPCTLTVELMGARALSPDELFPALRALELTEINDEVWERDAFALVSSYYDHGYLKAAIAPPSLTRGPDGQSMRARFVIEEGPQFRVRRYAGVEQIDGVSAAPVGGWKPSLEPGDVFSRRAVSVDLAWLRRIYRDLGYAEVSADPVIDLHDVRGEVDVRVPVTRGEVHTFGRIRIDGLKKVAEADVRRRLLVATGQRYSETGLVGSKEALRKSGLFESVDVSTQKGEGPRLVDVIVEVTEKRR